jgi:crotonobetainyl-CoA:carnitine CoA-transferase CaiB-like acyl-CoA transferase
MVEGAAYVGSWLFASRDMFVWGKPRGQNALDSGAHFYETYKTKDEKYLAVGALEPQFYRQEVARFFLYSGFQDVRVCASGIIYSGY